MRAVANKATTTIQLNNSSLRFGTPHRHLCALPKEEGQHPPEIVITVKEEEPVPVVDDSLSTALKPSEVVEKLDTYIVGQADAKRAVAIALRNRWRRHRLPEDLKNEVNPKNILMIGPTGSSISNFGASW